MSSDSFMSTPANVAGFVSGRGMAARQSLLTIFALTAVTLCAAPWARAQATGGVTDTEEVVDVARLNKAVAAANTGLQTAFEPAKLTAAADKVAGLLDQPNPDLGAVQAAVDDYLTQIGQALHGSHVVVDRIHEARDQAFDAQQQARSMVAKAVDPRSNALTSDIDRRLSRLGAQIREARDPQRAEYLRRQFAQEFGRRKTALRLAALTRGQQGDQYGSMADGLGALTDALGAAESHVEDMNLNFEFQKQFFSNYARVLRTTHEVGDLAQLLEGFKATGDRSPLADMEGRTGILDRGLQRAVDNAVQRLGRATGAAAVPQKDDSVTPEELKVALEQFGVPAVTGRPTASVRESTDTVGATGPR